MRTSDLIIVKAKITMKTTEEGGRQFGFKSGYRPNHVFELPDDLRNLKTYIGDIQFDGQELIETWRDQSCNS
jgi:translation elongation factor EF-Tu-like GTPase